jgi:hypothetical protein
VFPQGSGASGKLQNKSVNMSSLDQTFAFDQVKLCYSPAKTVRCRNYLEILFGGRFSWASAANFHGDDDGCLTGFPALTGCGSELPCRCPRNFSA